MKIGAENKKEVTIMAALLGVLLVVGVYNFRDVLWGSSADATPSSPMTPAPLQKGSPTIAAGGQDTDPNLRTDILAWSRGIQYEPGNRNPFAYAPPIPTPDKSVRPIATPTPVPTPTPIPTPPPIPLKFYGFANRQGEPKAVFLAHGEQNYVARLNEIVERRYKVVQIQQNSVVIEDMLNNNQQSIPYTPRP